MRGRGAGLNAVSATEFVLPSREAAAKGFPAGEAGAGVYGRPRLMRGRGAGLNVVSAAEFIFPLAGNARVAGPPGDPSPHEARLARFAGDPLGSVAGEA